MLHITSIYLGDDIISIYLGDVMMMAGDESRFLHIGQLAVYLLCFPFSNAAVERSFSIANVIKHKFRSAVRFKRCSQFTPSKEMVKMFNLDQVLNSDFAEDTLNAFNEK